MDRAGKTRSVYLRVEFSGIFFRKMKVKSKISKINLDKIKIRLKIGLEIKTAWLRQVVF